MVSITEEEGSRFQEHGVPGCTGLGFKAGMDAPIMSITNEDGEECELSEDGDEDDQDREYTWRYWEDEDDIYQEFEELDFEALSDEADRRSIASDDSFYPPDNTSLLSAADSPEPISFFKACCNNNTIIVKIMIRQGVTEEEVRETDRNRRVGGFDVYVWPSANLHLSFSLSRLKHHLQHLHHTRSSAGVCPQSSDLCGSSPTPG